MCVRLFTVDGVGLVVWLEVRNSCKYKQAWMDTRWVLIE